MLLSVIVPIFNSQEFLSECLDSILAQEYRCLELLLIDDGSTDDSGKICDEYAEKDSRVRVYHIQNSGAAAARNYGIERANGEYLGFVDSDDTVAKQMYRILMNAAKEEQPDIVVCNFYSVNASGEKTAITMPECERVLRGNEVIRETLLGRFYQDKAIGLPSMCNKIYRSHYIYENAIRIDDELIRAEDYWFNFESIKLANCIVVLPDVLYNYRQVNNNSIMHTYRENYYEELKRCEIRLRKENVELGFSVGVELSNAFAYRVQLYILELVRQNNKLRVLSIMKDSFYRDILTSAHLSMWSQCISWLVLREKYSVAYGLYCAVVFLKNLQRRS